MSVGISILSISIFFEMAIIIYFLRKLIKNQQQNLTLDNLIVDEEYLCTILLFGDKTNTEYLEIDLTKLIYDFSKYDKYNIVMLIEKDKNIDDIEPFFYPNQTIYRMKDGSFLWDYAEVLH